MRIQDYIKNFPPISDKDSDYFLFVGVLTELTALELVEICRFVFDQELFKRKILIEKIQADTVKWSEAENSLLFEELFKFLEESNNYHKKESASVALTSICSNLNNSEQERLIGNFLESTYLNNRKRSYEYLLENWSSEYVTKVQQSWETYEDRAALNLIIKKMPVTFLAKNYTKINSQFTDEDLEYDLRAKVLRNDLFAKLIKERRRETEGLKTSDPVSYLYIMKVTKSNVDKGWALEFYKRNKDKRFLARWFADLNLWHEIIKDGSDPRV